MLAAQYASNDEVFRCPSCRFRGNHGREQFSRHKAWPTIFSSVYRGAVPKA